MTRVGIIGAGITGLTAAYQLQRQGVPVTLYEAGDRVGGVIQTYRENGFLAEHGPNTALETSPQIRQLVTELDLEVSRLYPAAIAKNRFIVRDQKPCPMPTSLRKFLSTPLFSWRAKCRLIREPFIRRSDPKQEESLAEFVRRRLGREFLDYAINPFVSGIYAGAPERLSVYHAFRKLYDLEQRYGSLIRGQILGARERKKRGTQSKQSAPQFSFAEGLQTLTEGLRHRLGSAVRLQSPARRLQRVNGGWRVGTDGDASAEGGSSFHEAVVLAAPAYELARIEVENLSVPSLDFLEEIYYSPVSSLVLGFRREDVAHPLNGFGMLIPKVEPFKILGTLFSSSLFPGRAPEGHVTLTNYIGGVRAPELAAVKLEELIEMTCRDLSILLGVKGKPVFVHHAYFRKAIPQYDVGYGRFQNRMDEIERTCPGIYFGGNYRGGISLSDSILSGLNLAERIKNDLNPCPTEPVTHA